VFGGIKEFLFERGPSQFVTKNDKDGFFAFFDGVPVIDVEQMIGIGQQILRIERFTLVRDPNIPIHTTFVWWIGNGEKPKLTLVFPSSIPRVAK
jgi:hypothetical protein